jgi:hypothetical protein
MNRAEGKRHPRRRYGPARLHHNHPSLVLRSDAAHPWRLRELLRGAEPGHRVIPPGVRSLPWVRRTLLSRLEREVVLDTGGGAGKVVEPAN